MEIKLYIIFFLLGLVCGIISAAKLKINGTEVTNNIKKIKGNEGEVNVTQSMPEQVKKEGFLKRIFKRKK